MSPHGFTPQPVPGAILTPGGLIEIAADAEDEYPGYAVYLNGQLAAVVEWHDTHQCFVLRTYTQDWQNRDADPHVYHRWDGTPLEP